jgi:hypothetical protein
VTNTVRRFRIIQLYRVFEPQGSLSVHQRNQQAHVFNKVRYALFYPLHLCFC